MVAPSEGAHKEESPLCNRANPCKRLLVALVFFCVSTQSSATFALETFGDTLFRDYGLYSDLVVTGKIVDFGYTKIPGIRYFGSIGPDGKSEVIRVTLATLNILAGDYADTSLSFIISEPGIGGRVNGVDTGLHKLHVGDSVVAMLHYGLYDLGLFSIAGGPSFLKIQDDKLIPYAEKYSIDSEAPLRVLQEAAKTRTIDAVAAGSNVVCIANLLHNDTRRCVLTLEIEDVLKGNVLSKRITLDYLHDFTMWEGKGPKLLLFLRSNNCSYRLSAGMNSVYSLSGDKLLRNRLPLNTTFSKVREIVRMSKGTDEQSESREYTVFSTSILLHGPLDPDKTDSCMDFIHPELDIIKAPIILLLEGLITFKQCLENYESMQA